MPYDPIECDLISDRVLIMNHRLGVARRHVEEKNVPHWSPVGLHDYGANCTYFTIVADAALMATPRWRFQNLRRELFQFDSAAPRPLTFGFKPLLPVWLGLQF